MTVQFHFTARSDVGLVRGNNQDSGYASQHLLLVADGMGGPAGGDIASSVAVAHFAALDEDTIPGDELLSRLRLVLQEAHNELVERSVVDPQLKGLGTTCVAVLRSGNKLAMVHIGDSRAYLVRDGELIQVTTDHSFVQFLVDSGQITVEEAETHPKRSVILRVLGDSPGPVAADETIREAKVGDRWLLCSDGLSGVVSRDTLADVLVNTSDLDECADQLIELALRGGAPDNATCVLADVVPYSQQVPTQPMVVGAAAVDRNAPSLRGSGAAGKAAAYFPSEGSEDGDEPDLEAGRSGLRRGLLAGVGTLILLGGALGLWFGWKWTQSQFFVLADDNNVVVYQGIPQKLGPWEIARPIEVTDIDMDQLPGVDQNRLQEPVTRSNRESIDEYLEELRGRSEKDEPKPDRDRTAPSETPRPRTAPDPDEGGGA